MQDNHVGLHNGTMCTLWIDVNDKGNLDIVVRYLTEVGLRNINEARVDGTTYLPRLIQESQLKDDLYLVTRLRSCKTIDVIVADSLLQEVLSVTKSI
jgi:hypothetical protein